MAVLQQRQKRTGFSTHLTKAVKLAKHLERRSQQTKNLTPQATCLANRLQKQHLCRGIPFLPAGLDFPRAGRRGPDPGPRCRGLTLDNHHRNLPALRYGERGGAVYFKVKIPLQTREPGASHREPPPPRLSRWPAPSGQAPPSPSTPAFYWPRCPPVSGRCHADAPATATP